MKKNKIVIVLGKGIIIGFIVGVFILIPYISSQQYIRLKMSRIILLDAQHILTQSVLFFAALFLLSYLFWIVFFEKRRFSQSWVIRLGAKFIGLLVLFISIDLLVKHFKTFALPMSSKFFLAEFFNEGFSLRSLTGKIERFSGLLDIILMAGIVIFILFLFWLAERLRGKASLREKKDKFIKITAYVLIGAICTLNLFSIFDRKISIPRGPNVVLVVCDALRPDHLGYHGYVRDTSANIDLLAEKSAVFRNAYAQAPCTNPSMWGILISKYFSVVPLKNENITIAEYFRSNNYRTAAIISQGLLERPSSNTNQGFDVYDAKSKKTRHDLPVRRAESVTDEAIEWIGRNKDYPFFIWLVYFDPHDPYVPPDDFKGYYNKTEKFSGDRRSEGIGYSRRNNHLVTEEHKNFLINAYDEEIRYLDYHIGKLLAHLKKFGLYEDSIIILTADHGEELGDNDNLWDHCQILSQEEIWIPLILKLPNQKEGMVIEEAVQNIDIFPTVIDYFNKTKGVPFFSTIEGQSLLPLLGGEGKMAKDRFAVSYWREQQCIVMGHYKYWKLKDKEYLIDIRTRKR